MKLKKYFTAFAVLFLFSTVFLATNALTGQITENRKKLNQKPVRIQIKNRFYSAQMDGEKYWVHLPKEISSEYPTPIVYLLHGGVFKNVDY